MMRTAPTTRKSVNEIVGYRLLCSDGGLIDFGDSEFLGAPNSVSAGPWIALSATATGSGYVAVTAAGEIAGFGVAADLTTLERPATPERIVDIDLTPSGSGCRMLDAVGGVFCIGDATYHGSIPGLDPPVAQTGAVSIEGTRSGRGYWILDRAGGIFAFGDAAFFGSRPGLRLEGACAEPVDLARSRSGDGYCILEADGTLRSFGDAPRDREVVPERRVAAVAAVAASGGGLIVADARGLLYPTGTAPLWGSAAGLRLDSPVVDVAAVWNVQGSSA